MIVLVALYGLRAIPVHNFQRFAAWTFVAAAAALIPSANSANALSYTVTNSGPDLLTQLGNQLDPPSRYHNLFDLALSGTFGEGQINLDLLGFSAGINATVPQAINSYSFSETLKLSDGSGTTLVIPFNVSINYSDVLTIAGGSTFSFADSGGSFWQIVLNSLLMGLISTAVLYVLRRTTGQVTDPPTGHSTGEPACSLFASGIGAMGMFGWWKKRKKSVAAA